MRATQAGNLPRAVVGLLLDIEDDEYVDDVRRYNKVINEADHRYLHFTRIVLRLAGLVALRKGRFTATRKGQALEPETEAGELFALLFRTHFREFNLAYVDGCPEAPGFQQTIAYALWRFGRLGDTWRTSDDWAPLLMLPTVRSEILRESRLHDSSPTIVRTRALDPLVQFGLAESRATERAGGKDEVPWPKPEFRRTELFDRFLSFGV